jgi:hypothetical protein
LKICADENVAPKLSAMLREQLVSKEHTLETVDDYAAKGVDDQIWVRKFAGAGGEAIVGRLCHDPEAARDRRDRGNRAEAGDPASAVAAGTPSHSDFLSFLLVASHLYWWPHIEAVLEMAKPGQCFKVPWGWGETKDAIKPIPVDLQAAQKKLKRDFRRP